MISIKNDIVLSYIESLDVGAKLSVRSLSSELGVSEGTVYKAIKDAEARGLVVTRPKAGTFRVDTTISDETGAMTIAEIVKLLGLTVAAGSSNTRNVIQKLIICDSDEEQLMRLLDACKPENTLCVVGKRPDLQFIVVNSGANLLVTGGSRVTDYQLIQAEKKGVCILNSIQSTYTLVRLFDNQFSNPQMSDKSADISEWMQTPDYLYNNDIVADWHKFYNQNFSAMNQYPIVDDDLRISGRLDISRAFAANPSQRLSALTTDDGGLITVDRSASPHDVTKKLILSGSSLAAVVSDGKMDGVISSNDLLRYYMYTGSSSRGFQAEPFLSYLSDCSTRDRLVYRVRVPESDAGNFTSIVMSIMMAAAGRHLEYSGCASYKADSGTFYAPEHLVFLEGLMLTTSLTRSGSSSYIVEAEMHDDTRSYARAILMFSQT